MTPWEIVETGKITTEHMHQRALFAWANCAANYGFDAANDPRAYTMVDREQILQNVKLMWKPVPELKRLFAIHNQGHGDAIRGGRAKAEGVKAGVPDIMLPVPGLVPFNAARIWYHGLFIELKKPRVGMLHGEQPEWIKYLNDAGYRAVVCYGWEAAASEIQAYMRLT